MQSIHQLPAPGADALAHSDALLAHTRTQIAAEGGWISFARYMELALYTPGLGYYSGGSQKFGAEGDFITAPGITPLFGQSLARQVAQVMAASSAEVIEVGAGTGVLAVDLLRALDELDALPTRYAILELSGELRARQRETLEREAPQFVDRVEWLDHLPEQFSGCVVANEVLDVMPVHLLVWRADGIHERGVVAPAEGGLAHADRPATGVVLAAAQALPVDVPEGDYEYLSELCLASRAWVTEWAQRLQVGALLLIDYGYPQAEYYLPSRSTGTLQCYYRHRTHTALLHWPGLNDITAFVDFTATADAAFAAGLQVLGYTSQASFLQNCGLLELLLQRGEGRRESPDYIRAARAAQRLIAPHEMGELFKVLAVGRGMPQPLLGFVRGDRLHVL
ncbi:MAG: SAM-dependent methyltransferase [Moraxellaceae bacterium]|nr:SAM-dependent methyltransferase [Moraxellaceae bacterium]